MRKKFDKDLLGRAVVAVAERQHGVVSRAQLLGLGLTDAGIARRVRAGRLHRVHQGVYAVGRPSLTTNGRFLAAVVSCGPRAALSHFAAAVLWALLPERGPRIDVTVPTGGGRRRRGALIVHRGALPSSDVTVKDGIPVTTPARTLIDLADILDRRRLERAFDEAAYLRLDLTGVRVIRGRRGARVLRSVLAEHDAGSTLTRSELEERTLELCRRTGLPTPEVNVRIEGYLVDFVWREARLVVETDGWRAHGTRAAFERDRRRDADLIAANWRPLRASHRQLEREPARVAANLAKALRG
jgi:very-short-patch-repair endonuclease/predicted transcriptional regulator of viral defense system